MASLLEHGICQLCRQSRGPWTRIYLRKIHKYSQVKPSKPDRFTDVYRNLHGAVEDTKTATDFVYALKQNERSLLFLELQKFEAERKRVEGDDAEAPPTAAQLKGVLLHNALPFIGFGFLDNFVMITAGDFIDQYFGIMLGISTMAAAALGNWISDLAGVGLAHYVETVTSKFGVKAPALSPGQVDMSSTRWASNMGRAIGISIGCVIGMVPLLFLDTSKKQETAEDSEKS